MVSFASSAGDMVGLGSMFAVKTSVVSHEAVHEAQGNADISYVLHAVTRNRRELTLSWRSAFPATEEEGAVGSGLMPSVLATGFGRNDQEPAPGYRFESQPKQTLPNHCFKIFTDLRPIPSAFPASRLHSCHFLHVAVLISLRPAHLELLHRLPLLAAFALRHKVRFLKRASAPWRLNVTRRKVAASRVLLTMTWRWSGWRLVILALIRISLLKTLTLVLLHSCRRMALLVLPGIFHGMTLLLLMVGIVILLSLRIRWDVAASRRSIVVVV
ncbi:hypothetical protein KC360_g206 [Hortaea werneckii]|nr:hypothetical protein KC360_g206 [Hortaea werneckii]